MSGSDLQSGSDAASVELSSRIPSIELSLIGSDFRPVAVAMGRLSARVAPGIYQVVARAGPIVDRTLISLEPGATYRDDDLFVGFPAAAPVPGTTTSHEYHQELSLRASTDLAHSAGPPSGLLIVVRDVRGMDGPPLTAADLACFVVLDQSLSPLAGFERGWRIDEGAAIATWGSRLLAGGYALRTDPSRPAGGDRRPTVQQAYDMALWLSPGWQTIVFLTTGPGGPQTSAASVHMARVDQGWSPHEADVGLALELANWSLREGRSAVPDDLLSALLNTKFTNPMLGIVGAHSLFLRREPDPSMLRVVIDNLAAMVPGHPDVAALRWLFAERQAQATGVGPRLAAGQMPPGGVTWPPMLLPSYRALVAMDAIDPGVIVDGSPAERAAANLLVQGTWANWAPLSPAVRGHPPPATGAPPAVGVLPLLGREPHRIEQLPLDDPATARVAGYLSALAALEGPARREQRFATLSPQEIGLATTLPAATVDRTLARMAASMSPPPRQRRQRQQRPRGGGSTPPGPLSGLLPLLLLGGLLLGGALGVTWCAGNEECPVPIGRSDSTPAASRQPRTPQPTRSPDRQTDVPPTQAPATQAPATQAPETEAPATETPATPSPVTPSPEPSPVVFDHQGELPLDDVMVGGEPAQAPLTVTTSSPAVVSFAIPDNPEQAFDVAPDCTSAEVPTGLVECTVDITFRPARLGVHRANLVVTVEGTEERGEVSLYGAGVPAALEYPPELSFVHYLGDPPRIGTLTVTAPQEVPLRLEVTENAAGFFRADPSCEWVPTQFGSYGCTVEVVFEALDNGFYTALLAIVAPDNQPRTVRLNGTAHNPVD